jgi:hypothetical protein
MAEKIALADFLAHLREQLSFAWMDAQDQRIRFRAKTIELEIQVTASKEGGGGIKVWVLEGSGKAAAETVQRIKLTLEPVEVEPKAPGAVPKELIIKDQD